MNINEKNPVITTGAGALIGTLGGLIGLGGAEFRLPLLIGLFGYSALPAVILNKAMSLAVVASALPFRASVIPFRDIASHWNIIVTLLAGSLLGAWFGADLATKMKSHTLYRVLSILLVVIAVVLFFGHNPAASSDYSLTGLWRIVAGVIAGFGIGVVAALMGVAGGELLIPTIVLLFGADIKLAGSLSLAVSLPTMIVSFTRYSRDQAFSVIKSERRFVVLMVIGSLCGSFIGGLLLNIIPTSMLLPLLSVILLISAVKIWNHA
ncbi:MAG: sulfite exporter TauE/SafE family protein [Spirochaetota bacterium]